MAPARVPGRGLIPAVSPDPIQDRVRLLVEVTYAPDSPNQNYAKPGGVLPQLVAEAVECPEEPYDGNLQPGDVDE